MSIWRSKTRTADRDGRAPAVFDLRPGGCLLPKTHGQDDSAKGPYTEAHRCGAGGDLGGAVRRVVSMRTKLTGALVAIALPFFLGACSVFGGKAAEEPAYGIVLADGDIEIREYEGHAIAWTAAAGSFEEAVGAGFRRLFEYITGANAGGSDIAMTAPVLTAPAIVNTGTTVLEPDLGTDDGESPGALAGPGIGGWRIGFVLPDGYTAATAPVPEDGGVAVRDLGARCVASIRFSGMLDNKAGEVERQRLERWIEARDLEHAGDWRMAGYNPPWTIPIFRRNEVMVTLASC